MIIFVIALSYDNQWTIEWHTWLPYKTNQFQVHRTSLNILQQVFAMYIVCLMVTSIKSTEPLFVDMIGSISQRNIVIN